MGRTDTNILTVNAGSSSIKLDSFNSNTSESYSILLTGIGQPSGKFRLRQVGKEDVVYQISAANHTDASQLLLNWLQESGLTSDITAIGHRIVHGGPKYDSAALIDDELINYLHTFSSLDPEHAPTALELIAELRRTLPKTPQIACFDTAFFHDLPRVAQLVSLPKKYQAEGVRRYGFHGLSYAYLSHAFGEQAGPEAANGKVIYAHLGSGASLAAIKDGKPVDTTMGFTPTSGIIMSTRSGDIDPGLATYLQKQHGLTQEQFAHMTNFESGLLGVSGLSEDMYTLLQNKDTNPEAADAVDLFVYDIKKTIGAYAAVMGGLNSIVFSGGIGEQSAHLRGRICEDLGFLGVAIDNDRNHRDEPLISSDDSGVGVHVIPANEAFTIYSQVTEILSRRQS